LAKRRSRKCIRHSKKSVSFARHGKRRWRCSLLQPSVAYETIARSFQVGNATEGVPYRSSQVTEPTIVQALTRLTRRQECLPRGSFRDRFLDLHHEVLILAASGELNRLRFSCFTLAEIKQGNPLRRLVEYSPVQLSPLRLSRLAAALALRGRLLLGL